MVKTKVTFDEVATAIRSMDDFDMSSFQTCIAAGAMLAAGYRQIPINREETIFIDYNGVEVYASMLADNLLGLRHLDNVFLVGCWPDELKERYYMAHSVGERQEVAIEALRLELEKQS